jgi:hypothetical protein
MNSREQNAKSKLVWNFEQKVKRLEKRKKYKNGGRQLWERVVS